MSDRAPLLYRAQPTGPIPAREHLIDPKLTFWTVALLNMAAAVALALRGVILVRRGRIPQHRRSMLASCGLVVVFLLAYALKRVWLGTQDLSVWSPLARWNLWLHESFVTTMLIAGGVALLAARQLARTRRVTGNPADPPLDPQRAARHRIAGRVAVVCAVLGLLTAGGVWLAIVGAP